MAVSYPAQPHGRWLGGFLRIIQYITLLVKSFFLTLFRLGGGGILPSRTLDVYKCFNKQANTTKLGQGDVS